MEISRIRALRGPNLWTRNTAVEALVKCESNVESDLVLNPDVEVRLRHLFPGIGALRGTDQLEKITIAHALESATLHLQIQAGCPVTFSRTTKTPEAGCYQVAVEYTVEEVGKKAIDLAVELCNAALKDTDFDLDHALHALRDLDEDLRLGPSTGSIVDAALARGIPYRRLTEGSLVMFGWGSRQRKIQAAEMDTTSAIAESIAQDKELTKKLLHAAGVPVPKGRPVSDAEDAWAAAMEIGLPVVIKPRDGNQGKGVAVNLKTIEEVKQGFFNASQYSDEILIESYLPGSDYRLLVVGDRLIAAVLETARGGMLREGLAFDRCSVAVVTNIGMGDHLGLNYITTVEDLAVLKRVIVQNVAPSGMAVLNAADPLVAAMAKNCPGQVTFFALDSHHPVIATHRAQGKRVIFVEDDQMVAMQGKMSVRIPLSEVPLTRGGSIGFQIENAMASVAAAWATGLSWETIIKGLSTFISDAVAVPGRFNVFDYKGATVIADYGHNPDAIKALVQAVTNIPASRRSVVISGAGDRRDEDIREQTRIIGEAFEEVVLYQDACQRGREDGEVIELLRQGLQGARRTNYIEEIRGEFVAIDSALERLKPGELCLLLIDQIEEALEHITKRVAGASADTVH